jgi:hypothetical protein
VPVYDWRCNTCKREWEQLVALGKANTCDPCRKAGKDPADVVKLWKSRASTVRGDDIPGGLVVENLGHDPVTVYSHSERRRIAKERGLQEFVRHQPLPGTDKSPHTTNWATVGPESLQKAKDMLEAHASGRKGSTGQQDGPTAVRGDIRDYNPDRPPARFEDGQFIDPSGELS